MRLPNKLYNFNESVLPDMIEILLAIDSPIGIYELYKKVKRQIISVDRYIEALDCLFLINKIIFNKRTEMIYVNGN